MKWADRLGLKRKELESRPTIREIYFYNDPAVAAELDELQDLRKDIRYNRMKTPPGNAPVYSRAFPEEANGVYLKKLGSILGFPLCCVERYVFDRGSGVLTPEVRASDQLEHMEKPEDCDPYAYFTKDFFPCQPDCSNASLFGREMRDKLNEIDPEVAEQFAKHLEDNVTLVRQYPEIIQRKIDALEKVAGKAQEGETVEG
jgi:hypothetical protein